MFNKRLVIAILIHAVGFSGCYESTLGSDADTVDTWARTYGSQGGESARTILRVSSGGFVVGGGHGSTAGSGAVMLRLDDSGDLIWQKFIDGYDGWGAFGVRETPEGGFIAAGRAREINPEIDDDFWVFKVDVLGNLLWEKRYGDTESQEAYSIEKGIDGGYVVAGDASSPGDSREEIWILKIDDSGGILWDKMYGGPMDELASSIKQTIDGGYIVAGFTSSFGAGFDDLWILKLDPAGDPVWQRTYGGADTEMFPDISQTTDGGYIVSADTSSFGAGSADVWILNLDQSGNIFWQKSYGGSDEDLAGFSQQTLDGGYIVTGASKSFIPGKQAAWILRLNASGDILWQKLYAGPGDSGLSAIAQTSDGGFIAAGSVEGFGAGGGDVWVLKLDENGDIHGDCAADMIMMDTDATITDTAAQITDTFVTPVTSGIGERDSGAVATDADCIVTTQCEGS